MRSVPAKFVPCTRPFSCIPRGRKESRHEVVGLLKGVQRFPFKTSRKEMRTRRAAALVDDGIGTDAVSVSKKKKAKETDAQTEKRNSSDPSDAAAPGDKVGQKASRATKGSKTEDQLASKPDAVTSSGRKRLKVDPAQQQGGKAKESAPSQEQNRSQPTHRKKQQTPKRLVREVDDAAEIHQNSLQEIADEGKEPAALDRDAKDMQEDDDVPEEVSMAAGKAGAAQQRQQEREAARQKREVARARAEKRSAVAAEQKADREAQRAVRGGEAASQRTGSMPDVPEQDEEDDLLPPEVLAAVIAQSREAEKQRREPAAASKSAPPDAKLGSKARETRRKWDPTQPRRVGPVYVQILDQVPPPSASASALAFAKQRMFGGGHKRSSEMLLARPKQTLGRVPPAAHRGVVLDPV